MSSESFTFAMLSHPGLVRKGNEDTCAASPDSGAFVVCDGMGGAAAGEVASKMAGNIFLQTLASGNEERKPQARLDQAIQAANKAVFEHARQNAHCRGMGTTLVALLLHPAQTPAQADAAPALTLAHVGDSRCYLFRAGALTLLTQDHSLVEEQVRAGELTPRQAEQHPWRNVITRAVGSQPKVEPEIRALEPEHGDLYLLCSDGLTRDLFKEQIASTILRFQKLNPTPGLAVLCQTLIDEANHAGGGDNITVLLLHLR